MDTKKIEHLFLKDNFLLGLNFARDGIVPLRVLGREMVPYEYPAVSITNEGSRATTGTVAADTFISASRLTMSEFNIDNILRVLDCNHVYQVFMGIKPSAIRQYLYYPTEASRRGLDIKPIFSKSPYGYIDGFTSPYDTPSEQTEIWIPRDIDVGFAWHNPLNTAEQIDLNLLIVKYLVKVIRDADTVEAMVRGKVPSRIATVGGMSGESLGYNSRNVYNTDLIPFTATREEIEEAIALPSQ